MRPGTSDSRLSWLSLPTAALGVMLITVGFTLVGARALAAFSDYPENGQPGYLVLSTSPTPLYFPAMSPGDTAYAQVGVRLQDETQGRLSLALRKSGTLIDHPNGITLETRICDTPWTGIPEGIGATGLSPQCSSKGETISTAGPGDDLSATSPVWELGDITAANDRYVLVMAHMPSAAFSNDSSLMGLSGSFAVNLIVEGDDTPPGGGVTPLTPITPVPPAATPPGTLASTGVDVLALAAIAGGALLLGLIATTFGRGRSRRGGVL